MSQEETKAVVDVVDTESVLNDKKRAAEDAQADSNAIDEKPLKKKKKKSKRKYDEPTPDSDSSDSEKDVDDDKLVVEDDEEDDLLEIDTANIIVSGRRTRGKVIDYTKVDKELNKGNSAATAGDEEEEEDDGDFEEKKEEPKA